MEQSLQRSTFVTVLAWILIIFAGFGVLISIMQNMMINFMMPIEEINNALNEPDAQEVMPFFFRYIFSNIRIVVFLVFVIIATTFMSAIGLLKRKNWARIIIVVLFSLGICWLIFGASMQFLMFNQMFPDIQDNDMPENFKTMMSVMQIFMVILSAGMMILFGWIIKKLTSKAVKTEFIPELQ